MPADQKPPFPEPDHLGDGVYVSFDGYQLAIAVNDHRNKVAFLEPSVVQALVRYAQRVDAAAGAPHFGV